MKIRSNEEHGLRVEPETTFEAYYLCSFKHAEVSIGVHEDDITGAVKSMVMTPRQLGYTAAPIGDTPENGAPVEGGT